MKELKKSLKKGKIRKVMPDKVDLKLYRTLIHSLQWISVGYSSALYFAGKKLGKEIISEDIKGKDIKAILKEIASLFRKYGIGKIESKEVEEKRAVVQLKESASSYNMDPIGKTICFFEAGLIAGILEEKLKKKVTVRETRCGGLGDEVDEFVIRFG
ncbi:MAG: V4R domain-containing protein [Candidatus Aenigmatarchaeota archaeon]